MNHDNDSDYIRNEKLSAPDFEYIRGNERV
jgi:hypothetical protein